MKVITIFCDKCKKDLSNTDELITIGSESGNEFMYNNNISGNRKMLMSRYHDLHFCCKDCFIKYFINESNQ